MSRSYKKKEANKVIAKRKAGPKKVSRKKIPVIIIEPINRRMHKRAKTTESTEFMEEFLDF